MASLLAVHRKHHLGQVVVHLQKVVGKGAVLLRVQHLQQGRGGVAAPVHAHLVHLVQQKQRVALAGLGHALQDAPGHRAHIGAPVAADLGLVAHAAQRQPHILAPGGPGDGHPQRGLAHAGRPHQAQDRADLALDPVLHRQVFQNPVLDIAQAVVVLVQHLLGARQVRLQLAALLPGHVQHPAQIGAGRRGLRRGRGHRHQLGHLFQRLLARRPGHARRLDLLPVALHLAEAVALPQLLLRRLDLLRKEVLALPLLDLLLHPAAQPALHLAQLQPPLQALDQLGGALAQVFQLQQRQLLVVLQADPVAQAVDQLLQVFGAGLQLQQLVRDLDVVVVLAGVLGKLLAQGVHGRRYVAQRAVLVAGVGAGQAHRLVLPHQARHAVVLQQVHVCDAHPRLHLRRDPHAVLHAHRVHQLGQHAHPVQVVGAHILGLGVALVGQQDAAVVLGQRVQHRGQRGRPPDDQGRAAAGQHHRLAQRQHR